MTRKIINQSSPGTSSRFGGDDTDYINKYLTGVDQTASDPVDINTTTKYRSSKLQVANPANTFKYTLATDPLYADATLNLSQLMSKADQHLIGGWFGGLSDSGIGFLAANQSTNTITAAAGALQTDFATSEGKYLRSPTTTTLGNQAGYRVSHNAGKISRATLPWFKVKFRLVETTNNTRMFLGFSSASGGFDSGDDPLNAKSGIGLFLRAADTTNWQIARNDNTGATTISDTAIARDGNIHVFEIRVPTGDSAFEWRLDNSSWTSYNTDIPASTTDLFVQVWVQTNTTAARTLDLWYWFAELLV